MMKDLEIQGKSDRDLLVTAVTMLNNQGDKLDEVCQVVVLNTNRLTTLETEHRLRTAVSPDCPIPQGKYTTKALFASAGISGPVTIILYLILKAILKQEFDITI